jgi:23S rRNA pseudouridine1911/1915/1917 synthase
VSRLDAGASGVVVFACTSKAAARLAEQFRGRSVEKEYWAVVEGRVDAPAGECCDWLVKDERQQRMVIARENQPGAREARLSFRRLKVLADTTSLEIRLETGRKHQIRVQLASRGHPLVGDRKYGSRRKFADGIALHCRRLVIEHPVKKTALEFTAPMPAGWKAIDM